MSVAFDIKTINVCSEGIAVLFQSVLVLGVARQKNRIPRNGYFIAGILMSLMGTMASLYRGLVIDLLDNKYERVTVSYVIPGFLFFASILLLSQYYPGMLRGKTRKWPDALWMAAAVMFPAAALFLRVVDPRFHLVGCGFTMMYFLIYIYYQSTIETELMKKRLELSESRMTILTRQISPHFFFNVMKSLQDLCKYDIDRVEEAIGSFSVYLRQTLEALTRGEMVSFSKVLGSVIGFLEIEQMRCGERLKVEYMIETEDFKVPPFLLEPVLGSIIEGVRNNTGSEVRIVIATEENAYRYIIRLTDSRIDAGMEKEDQRDDLNTEIERARARLAVMCKGEIITSKSAGGTEAVIVIPKEKTKIRD